MNERWSNHETQAVAEVLENPSFYGDVWHTLAREHLTTARKSWFASIRHGSARRAAHRQLLVRLLDQFGNGTPLIAERMFKTLMTERMRRVNWTEIVDRYLDQVELQEGWTNEGSSKHG